MYTTLYGRALEPALCAEAVRLRHALALVPGRGGERAGFLQASEVARAVRSLRLEMSNVASSRLEPETHRGLRGSHMQALERAFEDLDSGLSRIVSLREAVELQSTDAYASIARELATYNESMTTGLAALRGAALLPWPRAGGDPLSWTRSAGERLISTAESFFREFIALQDRLLARHVHEYAGITPVYGAYQKRVNSGYARYERSILLLAARWQSEHIDHVVRVQGGTEDALKHLYYVADVVQLGKPEELNNLGWRHIQRVPRRLHCANNELPVWTEATYRFRYGHFATVDEHASRQSIYVAAAYNASFLRAVMPDDQMAAQFFDLEPWAPEFRMFVRQALMQSLATETTRRERFGKPESVRTEAVLLADERFAYIDQLALQNGVFRSVTDAGSDASFYTTWLPAQGVYADEKCRALQISYLDYRNPKCEAAHVWGLFLARVHSVVPKLQLTACVSRPGAYQERTVDHYLRFSEAAPGNW